MVSDSSVVSVQSPESLECLEAVEAPDSVAALEPVTALASVDDLPAESVDVIDSLRSEVASLHSEVLALRSVVAHLQAYGPPVPPALRPTILRAVLAARGC